MRPPYAHRPAAASALYASSGRCYLEEVRWLGLALIVFAASACGPIQSTGVLVDADAELRAAHRANAREQAPYEVELAEAYLRAGKEAKAHAQYQTAVRYGKKALACAQAAVRAAQPGAAAPADADDVACEPPYAVPEVPPTATATAAVETSTITATEGGRP